MIIECSGVGLRKFTVKRVLEHALDYLGQPTADLEMSLSVVSQQEIRRLNKQFRNVDSVTDVLSFPTFDNGRAVIDKNSCPTDAFNYATGKVNLGDVIICLDRAKQQAREYGHSVKREFAFLALHGLLHLLGYDHIDSADEQQMTAVQERVLSDLKIKRAKQ